MLVDMARPPEKEHEAHEVEVASPRYPYGLCISLGKEELAKLNLSLPEVGSMIDFVAKATVTSVSATENTEGGSYVRVELQITHMGLPEVERGLVEKMTARYGEKS